MSQTTSPTVGGTRRTRKHTRISGLRGASRPHGGIDGSYGGDGGGEPVTVVAAAAVVAVAVA